MQSTPADMYTQAITNQLPKGRTGIITIPDSAVCRTCRNFLTDHPDFIRVTAGSPFTFHDRSTVACSCARDVAERLRAEEKRFRDANLPESGLPHTFETWDHETEGTSEMFEAALRFAHGQGPTVLVLCGGVGAGKSYMLEAAGRYLMQTVGCTVRYETSKSLLDNLQSTFSKTNPDIFQDRMDWYQSRSVLLLDDVGAETSTDWRVSQLTDMIEHRLQYGKRLGITTNLDRAEMVERLGDRIGSRLFARNPRVPVSLVVTTARDYRR
jgi:DNA replication protein DnaC